MSTRSSITALTSDGTYKSIYCHFDGYPSNNGRLLMDNYVEQELIDEMVELGDMSSLGGHPDDSIYYGRDRGEGDETKPRCGKTPKEALGKNGQEYNYLWDGDSWSCNGQPIAEAVAEDE